MGGADLQNWIDIGSMDQRQSAAMILPSRGNRVSLSPGERAEVTGKPLILDHHGESYGMVGTDILKSLKAIRAAPATQTVSQSASLTPAIPPATAFSGRSKLSRGLH